MLQQRMQRYLSIDILRATAVLLMIQVHFADNLSWKVPSPQVLLEISETLGDWPAPLFTFLVGLSLSLWIGKQVASGRRDEEINKISIRGGFSCLPSVWLLRFSFGSRRTFLTGTS